VGLAIDDYVVAVTPRGAVVGCGALKEYSPSVAEVAAIAGAAGGFTAADLPGRLDGEGRLVLVRRLVREGLLEIVTLG
jgi:hypothetical protein